MITHFVSCCSLSKLYIFVCLFLLRFTLLPFCFIIIPFILKALIIAPGKIPLQQSIRNFVWKLNRVGLDIDDLNICVRTFVVSKYYTSPQQLFDCGKHNSDIYSIENISK